MDKKIKIIELFQKYSNNEELPKKIKYDNTVFELYEGIYTVDENCMDRLADHIYSDFRNLNDEVEILEDNTEEIEELPIEILNEKDLTTHIIKHFNKINELVRAYNKSRKEKE